MPTDVVMPQMGESIFEGTITKWLKKPGDKVQRDEPLFEISTDKVDAEIPAPASGVLKEIKIAEGATVQVNTVVGVIDAEGAGTAAPAPAPAKPEPKAAPAKPEAAKPEPAKAEAKSEGKAEPAKTAGATTGGAAATDGGRAPAPPSPVPQAEGAPSAQQPQATEAAVRKGDGARAEPGKPPAPKEREAVAQQRETVIEFPEKFDRDAEGERIRSSPLVRRIARDNNVSLNQVEGTGLGGRITKQDILRFVEQHGTGAPGAGPQVAPPAHAPAAVTQPQPAYQAGAAAPAMPTRAPAVVPGEIVPMSNMRKIIAERMVESKRTSAHVHSIFEVDVTRIVQLRERQKASFEQRTGTKLTVMPFFVRAAVSAIRDFPIINSSVEGDNIHYKREINIGIAVALDWGLIVPVVKNAEELNFLGIQRAINDLGERGRSKKLKPEEVQGGTFTITNPGAYGSVIGLPIIMQPQVAILGMGGIHKTPLVVTDPNGVDAIAIRSMIHLALGYDHRVVDGAVADAFMARVKKFLENWSEDIG